MIAPIKEIEKLIPYEQAPQVFGELRRQGQRIVQCHGTFDLVHPGHIVHLEEAKTHGDVLVITITGAEHVNKGPGRPYFNDTMRAKSLAALACVDYVIVIPFPAAVEAIECVAPHIYCKGTEYKDITNDPTGNMADDVETVNRLGGSIEYVGSVVYSSSKLLNNNFSVISDRVKEYCKELSGKYTPTQFRDAVNMFADLKVLLIGDAIFDRYTYVNVQGLTTKNRTVSSRFKNEDTQCGGSLAVYKHLKAFCNNVDIISLVGNEPWVEQAIKTNIAPGDDHIVRAQDFRTTVKQRFVEETNRSKELSKLFAVNYINEAQPPAVIQSAVLDKAENIIADYDLVLVTDFGHGLMQKPMRELVQDKAGYLGLNCQTNSNNHGFNIINRQYKKADCFSVDEQEMLLACGLRDPDFKHELAAMKSDFQSQYCWLTRGAKYTLGLNGVATSAAPSLQKQVTDTIGAGDALFSVVTLAARSGIPVDLSTFIGQLAGAQAVDTVGNTKPIEKNKLIKGGMSLLNY